eukprot:SAG22_NODE_360_length_11744_cov_37.781623_13_plen_132_part_00
MLGRQSWYLTSPGSHLFPFSSSAAAAAAAAAVVKAILFLCEVDNIGYEVGLSERLRSRVERHGRLEIGDAEADALVRTKAVHVVVLVVACVGTHVCMQASLALHYQSVLHYAMGPIAVSGQNHSRADEWRS